MPALAELEQAAAQAWKDPAFTSELNRLLKNYVGRATPLYEAERLTEHYRRADGGPRIWLKREDLNHTGAHKINNALGQALLALRMGKKRIIAETGAGQHGVATATVCARFGLVQRCRPTDVVLQQPVQLVSEAGVIPGLSGRLLQLRKSWHERLGNVLATETTKPTVSSGPH